MGFMVLQGNVLESTSDAIILTVDGAARGMEGNIARAFARKWPDVWKEMEEEVRYPIPLGKSVGFRVDASLVCPWRLIVVASTLHHLDVLSDADKRRVIGSAFQHAIRIVACGGLRSLSTAVMTGGWRLPIEEAFKTMRETYEHLVRSEIVVPDAKLCVLNKLEFKRVSDQANMY